MLPTAAAAVVAAAPATARGHDFWIEPSTFAARAGETVAISLRVGEGFRGDPVARDPRRIREFAIADASGARRPVEGARGDEPAGSVVASGPGVAAIVYESRGAPIVLGADKFEAYLVEKGLERVARARAERGETDAPGREVFSRCAKALVRVGGGRRGPHIRAGECDGPDDDEAGTTRPLGLPLELVAERDPFGLDAGDEVPVRLLFRGEPLAGALVVALPRDEPERGGLAARSDADGRVRFRLPRAGAWLVKAVHMVEAPPESGADWSSFWASLTFEVFGR